MPQADTPLTLVESAIAHVHAVLKRSRARRWLHGAAWAEWWAHCRLGSEPHQLHFDVNENLLRKGRSAYALQHPVQHGSTPVINCSPYLIPTSGSLCESRKPRQRPQRLSTLGDGGPFSVPAQLVSCVLYLTTGGGPTLVIDQISNSAALGARGWAVRPVAGRLVAYPGDRLHGVLPGADWLLHEQLRVRERWQVYVCRPHRQC